MVKLLLFLSSVCILLWVSCFWVDDVGVAYRNARDTSAEVASKVSKKVSHVADQAKDKTLAEKEKIEEISEKRTDSDEAVSMKVDEDLENVFVENTYKEEDLHAEPEKSDHQPDTGIDYEESAAAEVLAEIDMLLNSGR